VLLHLVENISLVAHHQAILQTMIVPFPLATELQLQSKFITILISFLCTDVGYYYLKKIGSGSLIQLMGTTHQVSPDVKRI
jgi:hypothetical protein